MLLASAETRARLVLDCGHIMYTIIWVCPAKCFFMFWAADVFIHRARSLLAWNWELEQMNGSPMWYGSYHFKAPVGEGFFFFWHVPYPPYAPILLQSLFLLGKKPSLESFTVFFFFVCIEKKHFMQGNLQLVKYLSGSLKWYSPATGPFPSVHPFSPHVFLPYSLRWIAHWEESKKVTIWPLFQYSIAG